MNNNKNKAGKKSFGDSQLKGNWGEQYIASKLTACGCLVRHVTGGHDSGIDLYCESVRNGNPFLHFFVQVKTSKGYKKSDGKCSFCEEDGEKIIYWKKQPVPVFIFLVPDERNIDNPPFFICSTLDFIKGKKTIESRIKISTKNDLEKYFLGKTNDFSGLLIENTFNWSLSKGHLAPLPNVEKSSSKWFPEGVMNVSKKLDIVSSTLHDTLWRISEDLLKEIFDLEKLRFKEKSNKNLSKIEPYMKALEAILETNKSSNVSRVTIGLWYAAKENYSEAQKWIKKGIEIAKEISTSLDNNAKCLINRQIEQSKKYLEIIENRMKKK